jgi:hypothetical protein
MRRKSFEIFLDEGLTFAQKIICTTSPLAPLLKERGKGVGVKG